MRKFPTFILAGMLGILPACERSAAVKPQTPGNVSVKLDDSSDVQISYKLSPHESVFYQVLYDTHLLKSGVTDESPLKLDGLGFNTRYHVLLEGHFDETSGKDPSLKSDEVEVNFTVMASALSKPLPFTAGQAQPLSAVPGTVGALKPNSTYTVAVREFGQLAYNISTNGVY